MLNKTTSPSRMTSRERMLAAIHCQPADHSPCSFMMYKGLLTQCSTAMEFYERELELGLDVAVQLPPRQPVVHSDTYNLHGLPVSFHPAVQVREWKDQTAADRWPVLHKEYHTPAGTLSSEVYQDEEWPYGDHVPFLDDYLETRSRKFIVSGANDLDALDCLLTPPTAQEMNAFREEAAPYQAFARRHNLLLTGGWGVGADLIGWVYGLQNMIYASFDQPDFLSTLLEKIAAWNRTRMQVVLDAGVDLYIKRAWYENCDFWSPASWKKYIQPILQADIALAHSHGARFGYFITSRGMPLLDLIAQTGVDVLIGLDPHTWDLQRVAGKLGGKVCLFGGVNGHLTVERGTPEEVQRETNTALKTLSPTCGFILSPVDNVRIYTPQSRENVRRLIDTWRAFQPPC